MKVGADGASEVVSCKAPKNTVSLAPRKLLQRSWLHHIDLRLIRGAQFSDLDANLITELIPNPSRPPPPPLIGRTC